MFTSVNDLAAAATEHRRALLDDATNFRLAREAKRARRRRRARAAAPAPDQGPDQGPDRGSDQGPDQRLSRSA
jgi:hypothetical protein